MRQQQNKRTRGSAHKEKGATMAAWQNQSFSCNDNGSGGGADSSNLESSVVPCSCEDGGGVGTDNDNLALLVTPHSHEQEGGMMRGIATTSQRIDERWQHNES